MRTKAGEKKRYSLRNIERKDFRTEEEVIAAVRKESKKAFVETKDDEKTEKIVPSGSTKRKRTKPEKTLNNKKSNSNVVPDHNHDKSPKITEHKQQKEKVVEILVEAEVTENVEQKDADTVINVPSESTPIVDNLNEIPKEEKIAPDMPVYQALGHAYNCKIENCRLAKCLIAKQFLEHYSTCNSGSDKCNICKAMDIMVRKHAQICQTPLEKCPIPKCDKVRLKVLDEWFEFSTLLRHAKACKDKTCDINKCKKIKLMFYHSVKCNKSDTCKTKAFVRQLCEHYKQEQELMATTNESEDDDFYTELLKRKKHELERQNQLLQIQQLLLACNNVPNLSSSMQTQNLLNSLTNNNNQNLDLPGGGGSPMMYPNSWGTGLMPLQNNNQCFYPNNNMPYSSFGFNQQQMFDGSNDNSQYDMPLESVADASDASISYPIPEDENEEEEEHTVDEFLGGDQRVGDLYQVSSPNDNNANSKKSKDGVLSNIPSPTRKMFYKLWSEKAGADNDNMKNALMDMSPDLKVLSRDEDPRQQFLSPVNNDRNPYSEIQSGYDLPNDDDAEEDPLPPMKSAQPKFNKMEDYLNMKRIYTELTEAQNEWCKIDFVKQHANANDDVNQVKDEAPPKLVPTTPQAQPKLQQGFVVLDQKPPNPAPASAPLNSGDPGAPLTSIGQAFLDLIKQREYKEASGVDIDSQ